MKSRGIGNKLWSVIPSVGFQETKCYKVPLNYPINMDYTVRIIVMRILQENRDNIKAKSMGIIPKWPVPFGYFINKNAV